MAATGFDKDYFRRRFKAETGKTPGRYLADLRIARAKQLLADSRLYRIGFVAENCGFADSLYFSTFFRKHTGLSPLTYRERALVRGADV